MEISFARGVLSLFLVYVFLSPFSPPALGFRQTHYPVTVRDDLGTVIKLKDFPHYIVSDGKTVREILIELGLKENLVEARSLSDQDILDLKPDIAFFLANAHRGLIEKYRKRSVAVFILRPRSFSDLYQTIRRIGKMCNRNNASYALVNRMQRRIRYAERRSSTLPYSDWLLR